MERLVGEVYTRYDEVILVVKSASAGCGGCCFDEADFCHKNSVVDGFCSAEHRPTNNDEVIFLKVEDSTIQI
jgi:hypothetical protein